MRIYRSLEECEGFGPAALTIGNFDGVHAGHRELLRRVVAVARARGWSPAAMTFDPHPARIVAPDRAPKLLSTPGDRCAHMAGERIAKALILPFTPEVARTSPVDFVEKILVDRLGVRAVIVGDNFRFGAKHAGDTRLLSSLGEHLGFFVEIVSAVSRRGREVSSSEIRRLIESGQVSMACRLLERPYALQGTVVTGRGVGKKQTVPTLNLATQAEILPARGVYVTRTHDAGSSRHWRSVTNIGFRPTFGGEEALSIETFLLDPLSGDSPREIRVEFLRRLRDERKFENPAELKAQILRDVGRTETYFRRRS